MGDWGAVQLRRAACCGRGRAEAGLLTAGDQCLYGVSHSLSLFRLQVKPCGRWPGIKHRWRSRVCFASAQHRRWEDAAGSRAAPGPKRGENKAV